jgi:S-adenosylmethionine/arginine decarboxylase-like enzyme
MVLTKDEELLENYRNQGAWGLYCSIDLKECNPDTIRNAEKIKEFVVQLCELIDMKRYGEAQVVHFGEDPAVTGYSMTQLIETSLISGHFANQTNAAYLDVFSCKAYAPHKAAEFCKQFFEAKDYNLNIVFRK